MFDRGGAGRLGGPRRLRGRQADQGAGVVEEKVDRAVRTGLDVADAAVALEQEFLAGDPAAFDLQASEFLEGQRSDQQVATPPLESRARDELDRADGECRRPLDDRRLDAVGVGPLADDRAVVVDAKRDDRPAVVPALDEEIQLVATARSVLGGPDRAGFRVLRHALNIPVAEREHGAERPVLAGEGVVVRDAAVGPDAEHLARRHRRVLRVHRRAHVADREVQEAIAVEQQAAAPVLAVGQVVLGIEAEEVLRVQPAVAVDAAADDPRQSAGVAVVRILRVADRRVDPSVLRVVRVERDVHQPAGRGREVDRRQPRDPLRGDPAVSVPEQVARVLRDQRLGRPRELDAPGVLQLVGRQVLDPEGVVLRLDRRRQRFGDPDRLRLQAVDQFDERRHLLVRQFAEVARHVGARNAVANVALDREAVPPEPPVRLDQRLREPAFERLSVAAAAVEAVEGARVRLGGRDRGGDQ